MEQKKKEWGWLKRKLAKVFIMDRKVSNETEIKEEWGTIKLRYSPAAEGTQGSYAGLGLLAGMMDGHPIRDTMVGSLLDVPDDAARYGFSVWTDSGLEFAREVSSSSYATMRDGERVKVRYSTKFEVIRGRSDPNNPITVQRKIFTEREFIGIENSL